MNSALQIHADAEPRAQATGLKLGPAFAGGDGYDKQLKALESAIVLLAMTGRLIDYAKQKIIQPRRYSGRRTMKPIACTIWAY